MSWRWGLSMLCIKPPRQGRTWRGRGAVAWSWSPAAGAETHRGAGAASYGRAWRDLPVDGQVWGRVCCSSGSLWVSWGQAWKASLQLHHDLGGEQGISPFISLLFDLAALSFPRFISYIFEVYCDEIWLYLSYKGFWSSLGSSLWRKIIGSGCWSSGWPRSLLYLVWKKKKKKWSQPELSLLDLQGLHMNWNFLPA